MLLLLCGLLQENDLDRLVKKLDARAAEIIEQNKDWRVAGLISLTFDKKRAAAFATYSFQGATRGGGEILLDGDSLRTRLSPPDASLIWDLGKVGFEALKVTPTAWSHEARALPDHVYVIHTLDTDTDSWVKLRILEVPFDGSIVFRWELIGEASEVRELERLPERTLKEGTVRLQLRSGAAGGHPARVYMNGKTDACVDRLESAPLKLEDPVSREERPRAWCSGGFIPKGKVWIVRTITYAGSNNGDTKGHGPWALVAKGTAITQAEPANKFIDGVWKGRLVVRPGEEDKVYFQVSDLSVGSAVFKGALVDEKWADVTEIPDLTPPERKTFEALLADVESTDLEKRDSAEAGLLQMGPPVVTPLRVLDLSKRSADFRRRVRRILEALDGE